MSTFLPSSRLLRSTLTSSRKIQINCVISFRILTAEKKTETTINLQPQLEYRHSPRKVLMSQKRRAGSYRNGQISTSLFRHSIQTRSMFPVGCRLVLMIPACCIQQDRFPTCEHRMTSRLLGCYHISGRESKTSTKRSTRNSPPSLGMPDCRFISSF